MNTCSEGYLWTRPGAIDEAFCSTCGTLCVIHRNVVRPTCFAEAMAKITRIHDAIVCPHSGRAWHNQAVTLRRAIEETPSPRVAALMTDDLMDVVSAGLRDERV